MNELVGKGRPFYSALDMGAKALKRKVGTGSEFLKELMALPGVKPTELKERGLEELMSAPKMTHEQFLGQLARKPAPKINEKVLTEGGNDETIQELIDRDAREYANREIGTSPRMRDDWSETYDDFVENANQNKYLEYQKEADKLVRQGLADPAVAHFEYTLPGGENYREMLIKDPQGKFGGVPAHFHGEPNIIASMRLKDRTGPNGEKLLHLEELQSDWHQQGREKGYSQGLTPEEQAELVKLSSLPYNYLHDNKHLSEKYYALAEKKKGVPDAPFKKNWEEMAIKRLIHHAAEKGYHGIVMTPGKEQNKRYRLSKHVGSVSYNPEDQHFQAFKPNRETVVNEKFASPERVAELIGKEASEKLLSAPKQMGHHYLEGEDLDIGGQGMKGFYDKKVPNIFNAVGKKHGVKMELHKHPIETGKEQMIPDNARLGMIRSGNPEHAQLHHFPITEPMREDVLKNGLPLYKTGGVVHKAEGGNVQPTVEQMRMALQNKSTFPKFGIQSIGANEAPDLSPKYYIQPNKDGNLGVGGVDMDNITPGMQLVKQEIPNMNPPNSPNAPQAPQSPLGAPPSPQGGQSNILNLTPQGQALGAMTPSQTPQGLAKGGTPKSVEDMKAELSKKKTEKSKRVEVKAEGSGGVKGIVVPRHLIEGNPKASAEGLKNMMSARAKIYGSEHREPLTLGQMAKIHKDILSQHFAQPREIQLQNESSALNRIRSAKFIKHNKDTLDESEKLDTVHHEHDSQGRSYVGYASKGIAGHALYPRGHGKNMDYKVINTCPGQTEGCGGGTDAKGIVDTSKGTCFAPNSESQYAAAASRRAGHAIAKHDPEMTKDWILAHTGSIRNATERADKQNKRMLFRPNVVDETDVSSRHVIRHLNEQRAKEGKPPIIANSYGKTNELHDPENGYYVTHSNVGPKTKHGQSIAENISRDKARIRNTILAADNRGDFVNEQGHKTPPKGSYMVTNVKRGSPMAKNMEKVIKHAKYWSVGRPQNELTKEEREEGPEGHFNGLGHPTTEDKSHYGHKTLNDLRFDYQRQHILHPRLVQVGHNDDGTPHMIPTDSRFKDEEVLNKQVKNRYMTKNGKVAGHILMTTPTESTSNVGHQTSFTHNVSDEDIKHAVKTKGEYVIDKPEDQLRSANKEYVAPQPIKIIRKADGGLVGERHRGYSDDDFHAFPEQNPIAQRHLAMRRGEDEDMPYHAPKPNVMINKNLDTMILELMRKK